VFRIYCISAVLLVSQVVGASPATVNESLQEWSRNPAKFLNRLPVKYLDRDLNTPVQEPRFSKDAVQSRNFVHAKAKEWKACHQDSAAQIKPQAIAKEPIRRFFPNEQVEHNLAKMEQRGFMRRELPATPWSGDFWPIAKGTIAARFMDPDFLELWDWLTRADYVKKDPTAEVLKREGEKGLARLSVAEKYDLLIGADDSFTQAMWAEGKTYQDERGEVEGWMGICHGWAAASIVDPRPMHSVVIQSMDQKWNLKFNPSEIKGLVSYTWAKNPYAVLSLGARCNKKDPAKDENGRVTDSECFDVNPGTWHKAVVNRVGREQKALVIDASFDYEVWNQPVFAYNYTYFNPANRQPAATLAEATVARANFTRDVFARYRSIETVDVVGVAMNVGYVVESQANTDETDRPEFDQIRWVQYLYDLELDELGNIVGGEWYQNAHPDFFWAPEDGAEPWNWADAQVKTVPWSSSEARLPELIAAPAKWMAERGIALRWISKRLLERASLSR
jgi:hypothetical protein